MSAVSKMAMSAGGIAVCAALLAGYFWPRADAATGQNAAYDAVPVQATDVHVVVNATGQLSPVQLVDIGAEVSGKVRDVYVQANENVVKDQLLATIYSTSLASRQDRGQATISSRSTDIRAAESNLRMAADDLERKTALAKQQLISRVDLDQARLKYEQAKSAVSVARADLRVAQADMSAVREDMAATQIRAPMDGVILSRTVEPGQTLVSSMTAPSLFRLASPLSRLQLRIPVDEADIGLISEGMQVAFTVDARPNRTFKGRISAISLEPANKDKGVTYPVVVDVPNDDMALLPGMTANAEIVVTDKHITSSLPASAVDYARQAGMSSARNSTTVQPLINYLSKSIGKMDRAEQEAFENCANSARSLAEAINKVPLQNHPGGMATSVVTKTFDGLESSLDAEKAGKFTEALKLVGESTLVDVVALREGKPTPVGLYVVNFGDAMEVIGNTLNTGEKVILADRVREQ